MFYNDLYDQRVGGAVATQWADTQWDAIVNWKDHVINCYGTTDWQASNLHTSGDVVHSTFLTHPVLVRYKGNDGTTKYIVNAEQFSESPGASNANQLAQRLTHKEQRLTIPLDILDSAGVDYTDLNDDTIIESSGDVQFVAFRNKRTGKIYRGKSYDLVLDSAWVPDEDREIDYHGSFVNYNTIDQMHDSVDPSEWDYGFWHILGGMLIQVEGISLLLGRDEGRFFASLLPGNPATIAEAYEMLKPPEVREAEIKGKVVVRQGEWFAVGEEELDDYQVAHILGFPNVTRLREATRQAELPHRDGQENRHVIRVAHVNGKQTNWATGTMFHRTPIRNSWWGVGGVSTGEHAQLRLGGWYRLYRNTELMSWSVGGNLD